MSSKKDMRRADLIVPYVAPPADKPDVDVASQFTGTMSSTLPMVAIVTRNKMLGWCAVVFSLQSYLSETPAQKRASATPGYFSVMMAFMSLAVGYMPLFLPPVGGQGGTGTAPPAAAPPS